MYFKVTSRRLLSEVQVGQLGQIQFYSHEGWATRKRVHTHQVKEFDPERIVLSAQAEGLGNMRKASFDPERIVRVA